MSTKHEHFSQLSIHWSWKISTLHSAGICNFNIYKLLPSMQFPICIFTSMSKRQKTFWKNISVVVFSEPRLLMIK